MNRRLLLIVLPLLLVVSSPAVVMANTNAGGSPNTGIPQVPKMPTPPSAVGCYSYSESQSWESTPCQSAESSGPGPAVPTEGNNYAIYGVAGASTVKSAWEDLIVPTFNGESDSYWGTNAFSVQLNTNTFTGSNGDNDWVQFVLQNDPNTVGGLGPYYRACIWENDLSTVPQTYTPYCVSVPSQALYTNYQALFNASVSGGSIYLTVGIYISGTYTFKSVSHTDTYGLASNWYDASGTVLGFGGGYEAVFTHPATVYADLGIARFTSASGGSWTVTGEQNNLAYTYTGYTGCSGNICFEDTTSTY